MGIASALPRRRFAFIGLWVYFLGYGAWAVLMLRGTAPRGPVNDLLALPLFLAAGGACWIAARGVAAVDLRTARGWRLVSAAWLASAAGTALWLLERAVPADPIHWIGWLAYNAYFPFLAAGLWHFFEVPSTGLGRLRLGVESLMVVAATTVLAWYFIFRFDEATRSLADLVSRVFVLFLGELVVLVGAGAVLQRPTRGAGLASVALLSLGTFVCALADFLYDHSRITPTEWSGPTGDLIVVFGAALVASGGLLVRTSPRPGPDRRQLLYLGVAAMPFLAVAVVAVLVSLEIRRAGLGDGPVAGLVLGGGILLALLIARLIVGQREFELESAELAAQDAQFRSVVEQSSDGIVVVSREGVIQFGSPTFCRLVGLAGSSAVGRDLAEYLSPEDRPTLARWLVAPPRAGAVRWRMGALGAEPREVEVVATDQSSDPLLNGIVVNVRDITERLRLEQELQQAKKLEVVGRLSSSVAHDFNNLLMVILGNLRLARMDSSPFHTEEMDAVEAAAERGAALARQLLSLSRPSTSKPQVIDLSRRLAVMENTLRKFLPSSIELGVSCPEVPMMALLDEVRLEQVILNLALNARDAMPSGGRLEIQLDRVAGPALGRARITVRDTGAGMSEATRIRAFEPFFTTKEDVGTGLGLSTVQSIVREAGGEVSLTSSIGRGTTVTLLLPLVEAPAAAAPPRPPASAPQGVGRILVVDDEAALRHVLAKYLGSLGYQVSVAADGHDAITALERDPAYDLVLTDLVMPRVGGKELVGWLENNAPEVGILCMSGTPGATGSSAEPWSASRVIAKPVTLEVVAARVADVLEGNRGAVGA